MRVDVSTDGGGHWHEAELAEPVANNAVQRVVVQVRPERDLRYQDLNP